ncbi:sigma 54-interacting transcriptional regulator [Magnetococcales bacterium HHB-1]
MPKTNTIDGRILVVEDNTMLGKMYSRFLEIEGFSVDWASSVSQAKEKLQKKSFHLVFADFVLPNNENGLDLLQWIRKKNATIYVIIITSESAIKIAQQAMRAGAFDFLSKPITRKALIRVSHRALEHRLLKLEKEQAARDLEAIFNSVSDAIITVNAQLILHNANAAAEKILGITQKDMGKSFNDAAKYKQTRLESILREVCTENRPMKIKRLECQCGKEDDHVHIVNVSVSPLLDQKKEVKGAVMVVRDETQLVALESRVRQRDQLGGIVGRSQAMKQVYRLIHDLAQVETTALIIGESGTGKELVAEALHYQGARKKGPLVKVNCAALTDSLLESELFGHTQGAFTGAVKAKDGRFLMADKGTIFLDEIGDISARMQTRLLRVLQEREFEPVGGTRTIKVDVRVVAATNRNLADRVAQGEFREDLYYRLKVVELRLPPLRERREDVPLLVEHFIHQFNPSFGKSIASVSPEVMQLFMNHTWPGNVRELKHVIEYAFVVCRDSQITTESLPEEFRHKELDPVQPEITLTEHPPPQAPINPQPSTPDTLATLPSEEERILQALEKARWVKTKAAKQLNMSRNTLYRKMRRYQIN